MFENEFTWGKALSTKTTDEFDEKFDSAFEQIQDELGQNHPVIIGGKKLFLDEKFELRSPADTNVIIGTFQKASVKDTIEAINSAKNAFIEWSHTEYKSRAKSFQECADRFSAKKFELAALMSVENGKTRLEAMGDVDESIDFMRYYAYQLEQNSGFEKETYHPNPHEKTKTVLKPYGVWGIIAPFNFPSAIAIGMTCGALITGNTAVLKPASDAPLSSLKFAELIYDKIPVGAINYVTGDGDIVGKTLIESNLIDGIAFTGSKQVGISGFHEFTKNSAKPFISEMGGKNPVIVTDSADIDDAATGVVNAAFGYGGQKCSACSRVYVQESVYEKFLEKIVEQTQLIKIGLPWKKSTFLGPIINEQARTKYYTAISTAKKDGRIVVGGDIIESDLLNNGYYVMPTIITDLPIDHKLMRDELFLPILCVSKFEKFDDAIRLANDTDYGLTAGIFSKNQDTIDKFFGYIQAGVLYANRTSSATTAALVSSQPFVGWKDSGISGKGAGGENYLQQFLRAQTQTRCD